MINRNVVLKNIQFEVENQIIVIILSFDHIGSQEGMNNVSFRFILIGSTPPFEHNVWRME